MQVVVQSFFKVESCHLTLCLVSSICQATEWIWWCHRTLSVTNPADCEVDSSVQFLNAKNISPTKSIANFLKCMEKVSWTRGTYFSGVLCWTDVYNEMWSGCSSVITGESEKQIWCSHLWKQVTLYWKAAWSFPMCFIIFSQFNTSRSEWNSYGLGSQHLWWRDPQACAMSGQMPESQRWLHRKIIYII